RGPPTSAFGRYVTPNSQTALISAIGHHGDGEDSPRVDGSQPRGGVNLADGARQAVRATSVVTPQHDPAGGGGAAAPVSASPPNYPGPVQSSRAGIDLEPLADSPLGLRVEFRHLAPSAG